MTKKSIGHSNSKFDHNPMGHKTILRNILAFFYVTAVLFIVVKIWK